MKQNRTANPTSNAPSYQSETLACRQTALDSYCRLFARGYFPILVEQADGMFRVSLPTVEQRSNANAM